MIVRPAVDEAGRPASSSRLALRGECGFRNTQDPQLAMSMREIRTNSPQRHDRLWPLNTPATPADLLGGAGEAVGLDKLLNTGTTKRRTHSLFRRPAWQVRSKHAGGSTAAAPLEAPLAAGLDSAQLEERLKSARHRQRHDLV